MDWKHVEAGDVICSPAKTIHAIGAGIALIEVEQNVDLNYRLYDYGRPRELYLEDGIAVSDAKPFNLATLPHAVEGRQPLAANGKLVLERRSWSGRRQIDRPAPGWLVPVIGGGQAFAAGQCWLIEAAADLLIDLQSNVVFASSEQFNFA